jgi:minor extracellular serine protease Vpr
MKPELVAVATDMYMATQTYDPNGDMHDPSGFFATQGTSFAAPQVAGVLALLKQRNPQMTPGQLKSAVVNTANPEVTDYDGNGQPYRARVVGVGAGLLDAETALRTNITTQRPFLLACRSATPILCEISVSRTWEHPLFSCVSKFNSGTRTPGHG